LGKSHNLLVASTVGMVSISMKVYATGVRDLCENCVAVEAHKALEMHLELVGR
jgi:hypothetical protein